VWFVVRSLPFGSGTFISAGKRFSVAGVSDIGTDHPSGLFGPDVLAVMVPGAGMTVGEKFW